MGSLKIFIHRFSDGR